MCFVLPPHGLSNGDNYVLFLGYGWKLVWRDLVLLRWRHPMRSTKWSRRCQDIPLAFVVDV